MQNIVNINSHEKKLSNNNLFDALQETNKYIPTRYLYDDYGSKLFEEICETKEYYLTRTEKKILDDNSKDIVSISNPQDVFELGSGSSKKTKSFNNILSRIKNICLKQDV